MRRIILLVVAFMAILRIEAQYASHATIPDTSVAVVMDDNDLSYKYAKGITKEDMRQHLSTLASDDYEGRETGTKANDLAAGYIARHFQSLGLPTVGEDDTYYQSMAFNKTSWSDNSININGNVYKHLWDYLSFATINDHMPSFRPEEVVFLGFGIDDPKYSDYKGNDVKGKVIMINKGEPFSADSISYITGTNESSDWDGNTWKKLKTAQKNGVKLVLVIENELKEFLGKNRRFLVSASLQLGDGTMGEREYANHIYISSTMAKDIIGSKDNKIKKWREKNTKKAKAKDICLKPELYIDMQKDIDVIKGYNVMGYVEGSDKKDELIVVSAHYDHLGKRGNDIFNGADDNGSGTTTVLEMAEALSMAKKEGNGPRRSVLFLLVTGEEKGLLGSKYYAENPIFPIANTVANVNVDMVGRVDEKYQDNPNYIYVIGSDRLSTDLHKINEDLNQKYSQIIMDYKYNDAKDPNRYYFRSDHYNFAKKGIPAIFFFSGTHEDYHRPSDTVEKIMFPKMEKIGRHIFHVIWELSNREDRIVVDGDVDPN